eukprot:4104857-Ditylum_brightwellii.AAC.1
MEDISKTLQSGHVNELQLTELHRWLSIGYSVLKIIEVLALSATPVPPFNLEKDSKHSFVSIFEDNEFNHTLGCAREAESRYGLCSSESERLWKKVDDLYKTKRAATCTSQEHYDKLIEACVTFEQKIAHFRNSFDTF